MSSPSPAPNCSDPAAILNRIYQLYEMIQNILQILGQLKSLCGKSFSEIAVNFFQLSMALGTFVVHALFFFTPSLNPLGGSASSGGGAVKDKTVAKPLIMVEEAKDEDSKDSAKTDSKTDTTEGSKDISEKRSTGKTTLVTVTEESSSNAQDLPTMAEADHTTKN